MAEADRTDSQVTPQSAVPAGGDRPVAWRLHIVACPDRRFAGRVIVLPPNPVLLGRDAHGPSDLRIDDPALSRHHAELTSGPTGVALRDVGSRNGVHVAGRRVPVAVLGQHAVLRAGDTLMVVEADHGRADAFDQPTANVPGQSEAARQLRAALDLAARDLRPVLIAGPTGAGKEFAASELHQRAGRFGKLVRVNVAAIPESLFEAQLFGYAKGAFTGSAAALPGFVREADGGTLVLDEIGELPKQLQPKLLRLLEDRTVRPIGSSTDLPVQVRFVGTTNADLAALARQGQFRVDLLGRLSAWSVTVPSLAVRRPDILAFCDAVAPLQPAHRSWAAVLDVRSAERLLLTDWPFNLRSLQAVLVQTQARMHDGSLPGAALAQSLQQAGLQGAERGVAIELRQKSGHEPTTRLDRAPPPQAPWRPDADLLRSLLREHAGSINHVAQALGRDRRQVYRWMQYAKISEAELQQLRGRAEP